MELHTLALLSLQQALLGMVTRDLRAVECWIEPREVRASFKYEKRITEDHRAAVTEVETLVMADLPDHVAVQFEAVCVPLSEPAGVVRDSVYALLRQE